MYNKEVVLQFISQ